MMLNRYQSPNILVKKLHAKKTNNKNCINHDLFIHIELFKVVSNIVQHRYIRLINVVESYMNNVGSKTLFML